jgi:hypothetical protein
MAAFRDLSVFRLGEVARRAAREWIDRAVREGGLVGELVGMEWRGSIDAYFLVWRFWPSWDFVVFCGSRVRIGKVVNDVELFGI